MSLYCQNCEKKILNLYIHNDTNSINYHFLCKKCLKKLKVCSKSKCKKLFLLNDIDIKNLKIIYLDNNQHFFLYEEVKKVVINKYGNLDNLQKILDKKSDEKKLKIQKNNFIKTERENILMEAFKFNKLEYKNYGDCYSYINYGEPSLETVINNELIKIKDKNNRRMELAHELKKLNINLDESLKSCYEYINKIGCVTLKEIVRNIEIEYFLKNNTEYEKLCKIYKPAKAKDKAIRKYMESQHFLPNNIDKKIYSTNLIFE